MNRPEVTRTVLIAHVRVEGDPECDLTEATAIRTAKAAVDFTVDDAYVETWINYNKAIVAVIPLHQTIDDPRHKKEKAS